MEQGTAVRSVDVGTAPDPWEMMKLHAGDLGGWCREMAGQAEALRVFVGNGYTDHFESVSDPDALPGDLDAISRWATRIAVELGWVQEKAFELSSAALAGLHASPDAAPWRTQPTPTPPLGTDTAEDRPGALGGALDERAG